jgi:hypothetical protein
MILRKMAAGNETGQALHKNGLRLSTKQGAVHTNDNALIEGKNGSVVRKPYQALLALDNPGQYLREGVTLEDLKSIASACSHNGYARLMQAEKEKLFRKVLPTGTAAIRKGGLAKELRRSHAG